MPQHAELCHSQRSRCTLSLLFPHWLIVTGVVLAMFGIVGLAFHRNKQDEAARRTPPAIEGRGPMI
jgi:hypothetical protein